MFKKQAEDQQAEEVQTTKPVKINEELERQCEEYLNGWKRAQADYNNLQKTTEKERTEWIKFANQGLLMQFLPIYDHLKLAVRQIEKEQRKENWLMGVENIKNEFAKFLSEAGVEEIKTLGEKFNPEEHEAVVAEKAESDEHQGIIKEELRGGYKLNGKVLYPARVVVE